MIRFVKTDGGRSTAGFVNKATSGDCVARAVAIASGRPYGKVYDELAEINASMPLSKHRRRRGKVGSFTASHGIWTRSKLFKDYMRSIGFEWVPTMQIGSGCRVHVRASELPKGRIILALSKHYAAVIDGVLHDMYDCSRDGTRCVYGYWNFAGVAASARGVLRQDFSAPTRSGSDHRQRYP
jgi:hypothetical protein